MTDTPEPQPAQFLSRAKAVAAAKKAAPVANQGGEMMHYLHVWASEEDEDGHRTERGSNMYLDDVLNMIDQAATLDGQLQCAYVESKYGRCLHVYLGDGRLLKFDTVTP